MDNLSFLALARPGPRIASTLGYVAAEDGPPVTAGMTLHLDASNTGSITAVSGEMTVWADLSGNGYDFTAETVGQRPEYGATTQNGIVVPSFDGTMMLARAGATVVNQTDGSHTVVAIGNATDVAGQHNILNGDDENHPRMPQYLRIITSTLQSIVFQGTNPYTSTSGTVTTGLHTWSVIATETSVQSFYDGTGSTSASIPAGTLNIGEDRMSVGGRPMTSAGGGTPNYKGTIYEILMYNVALSTGELASVESYLTTKWS